MKQNGEEAGRSMVRFISDAVALYVIYKEGERVRRDGTKNLNFVCYLGAESTDRVILRAEL